VAVRPRNPSFRSRGVHSLSQSNEFLVLAIHVLATRAMLLCPGGLRAMELHDFRQVRSGLHEARRCAVPEIGRPEPVVKASLAGAGRRAVLHSASWNYRICLLTGPRHR
jgi:hypothetical protein